MTVKSWRAAVRQDGVAVRKIRLWGELDAELRTCETSNRDDSTYKDPRAVPGIEESPHLFEAPPITTTANLAIDDSCDRDGCESMARRNTQRMTEVAADRSLILDGRGNDTPDSKDGETPMVSKVEEFRRKQQRMEELRHRQEEEEKKLVEELKEAEDADTVQGKDWKEVEWKKEAEQKKEEQRLWEEAEKRWIEEK
ncbi:hypothetical protein BU17DRAFT_100384 [Hysterangium stoloniferum]|nr:hypothetical protein BU17DRAFT_100384 [Hysterangium stoloniferum]